MGRLFSLALALAGAWYLYRQVQPAPIDPRRSGEPQPEDDTPPLPAPGILEAAGELGTAYGGYPPSTPVIYVGPGGDVVRETTTGELSAAFSAVDVMRSPYYLPSAELQASPARGTGEVFKL